MIANKYQQYLLQNFMSDSNLLENNIELSIQCCKKLATALHYFCNRFSTQKIQKVLKQEEQPLKKIIENSLQVNSATLQSLFNSLQSGTFNLKEIIQSSEALYREKRGTKVYENKQDQKKMGKIQHLKRRKLIRKPKKNKLKVKKQIVPVFQKSKEGEEIFEEDDEQLEPGENEFISKHH